MESALLNKVIDGLTHCAIEGRCPGCPYDESDACEIGCMKNLMKDSLYLHTERIQGAGYLVDWDTPHEI